MWASTSRAGAAQFQLSMRLGSSTLRLRVPALLSPPSAPSAPLTPALATASPDALSGSSSPAASELIGSLWDGLLRAVPKSKVSHSRKSMRSANKGLKDRVDLVHCSACGKPKLQHHICSSCYFELNRQRKVALKGQAGQQGQS